jgi:hypothetical protein
MLHIGSAFSSNMKRAGRRLMGDERNGFELRDTFD